MSTIINALANQAAASFLDDSSTNPLNNNTSIVAGGAGGAAGGGMGSLYNVISLQYQDNVDNGNNPRLASIPLLPSFVVTTSSPADDGSPSLENMAPELIDVSINRLKFIVLGVIGCMLAVLGFLGNTMSMVVLQQRQMRSSTSYYLLSLAIYDNLILISMLLYFIIPALAINIPFMKEYLAMYSISEPIGYPLSLTAQMGSIYTCVGFTVERFIAVCRPLQVANTCTKSRTIRAILLIFAWSVLYNIPRFFHLKAVYFYPDSAAGAAAMPRQDEGHGFATGSPAVMMMESSNTGGTITTTITTTTTTTAFMVTEALATSSSSSPHHHHQHHYFHHHPHHNHHHLLLLHHNASSSSSSSLYSSVPSAVPCPGSGVESGANRGAAAGGSGTGSGSGSLFPTSANVETLYYQGLTLPCANTEHNNKNNNNNIVPTSSSSSSSSSSPSSSSSLLSSLKSSSSSSSSSSPQHQQLRSKSKTTTTTAFFPFPAASTYYPIDETTSSSSSSSSSSFFSSSSSSSMENPPSSSDRVAQYVKALPTSFGSDPLFRNLYLIYSQLFFMFLLPFLIILFMNIGLIRAVKRSKAMQQTMGSSASARKERNLTVMLIAVIVVFLVCQFPTIVDNILIAVVGAPRLYPDYQYQCFYTACTLMVLVNSASNFLLYCFFGKKFRVVLLSLLGIKKRQQYVAYRSTMYRSRSNGSRACDIEMSVV